MMRTNWAVLALVIAMVVISTGVAVAESESSPKTTGLSGVSWATGSEVINSQTLYYYEWTLYNNTGTPLVDCNGKPYQVLVDILSISNTLPEPMDWRAPEGWTLNWQDQKKFERYAAEPSLKYYVPPSVGPGTAVSGFRTYYDYLPLPSLEGTTYLTHVLAVDPDPVWSPTKNAYRYSEVNACIPYQMVGAPVNANTWWDRPGTPPTPEIPEATAIMLGITGLGGFAAFRRFRK